MLVALTSSRGHVSLQCPCPSKSLLKFLQTLILLGCGIMEWLQSMMEMCCSCFMDMKYECLRCNIPICNKCSVFEENEDVEEWRAGRSVAYCEASDRELKRATQGLMLSEEQSIGSFRSHEKKPGKNILPRYHKHIYGYFRCF